jgi:hypothetical protein
MAARFVYCWSEALAPRRPALGQRLVEARAWKRLRTLPWPPLAARWWLA